MGKEKLAVGGGLTPIASTGGGDGDGGGGDGFPCARGEREGGAGTAGGGSWGDGSEGREGMGCRIREETGGGRGGS